MTVTTCNEQPVCLFALASLRINPESLRPKPPSTISDGLMQLSETDWLIVTNKSGQFTIHVLENASKTEAWDYFHALKPAGVVSTNPRAVFLNSGDATKN